MSLLEVLIHSHQISLPHGILIHALTHHLVDFGERSLELIACVLLLEAHLLLLLLIKEILRRLLNCWIFLFNLRWQSGNNRLLALSLLGLPLGEEGEIDLC